MTKPAVDSAPNILRQPLAICTAPNILVLLAWAGLLACAFVAAAGAQPYVATDLGLAAGTTQNYPYALNSAGRVAGASIETGQTEVAYVNSNGVLTNIGNLGGSQGAGAQGINDSGTVVGASFTSGGSIAGFVYNGETMTSIGTLGGFNSYALGINNAGVVVGASFTSQGFEVPITYSGGVLTPLNIGTATNGEANAINLNGAIAGYIMGGPLGGSLHAFSSYAGTTTDLGTLGGLNSVANAINGEGTVVGYSDTAGQASTVAFSWSSGTMTSLGTLGGTSSVANGINDQGYIVGKSTPAGNGVSRAFIYVNGAMADLNPMVQGLPNGVSLMAAFAINDFGMITAQGTDFHGYLLTPVTYSVTTLGPFPSGSATMASGINAYGVAVGNGALQSGFMHAFSTTGGSLTDLGTLAGGNYSSALAINAVGTIVGSSSFSGGSNGNAFVYSNGTMTNLGTLGGPNSVANAINSSGTIVGLADTSAAAGAYTAFSYSGGTMTNLELQVGSRGSEAFGINDSGTIVGWANNSSGYAEAFSLSNGTATSLGTLGGNTSEAYAINASGTIVGWSATSASGNVAFSYSNGTMTSLGSLAGAGGASEANAINSSGTIVGFTDTVSNGRAAFIDTGGVMFNLNAFISSQLGVTVTNAFGINDGGQIVVVGLIAGASGAYLLTPAGYTPPTPTPTPTPTPSPSPTPTPTVTPTPTPSPSPTPTPTVTPSPTPTSSSSGSLPEIFATIPGNVQVGVPYAVALQAYNFNGTPDPAFNGTVTVSFDTPPVLSVVMTNGAGSFTSTVATAPATGFVPFVVDGPGLQSPTEFLVPVEGATLSTAPVTTTGATPTPTPTPIAASGLPYIDDRAAPLGATVGTYISVSLAIRNSDGSLDAGYLGDIEVTPSDTNLPVQTIPVSGGLALYVQKILDASPAITFTITAPGTSGPASFSLVALGTTVTIEATTPGTVQLGAPFTVTLQAVDSAGAVDQSFNSAVTISSTNPATAVKSSFQAQFTSGTATFETTAEYLPASGEITFVVESLAAVGNSFAVMVTAAPPTITATLPDGVSVGQLYTIPLQASDGAGALDTQFNGTVTVTFGSTAILAPVQVTMQDGVGSLYLPLTTGSLVTSPSGALVDLTFTISGSGLAAPSSFSLLVDPNLPEIVVYGRSQQVQNVPFVTVLYAVDPNGDINLGYNGTVTVTTSDSNVPAVMVDFTSGKGTFTTTIPDSGTVVFNATGPGLSAATSYSLPILYEPASIATEYGTEQFIIGTSGEVKLEARDGAGNLVPYYDGTLQIEGPGVPSQSVTFRGGFAELHSTDVPYQVGTGIYTILGASLPPNSKFTVPIVLPTTVPTISVDPAPTTVEVGQSASLWVGEQYAVSFQWYFQLQPIAGATSPTYTIPSVTTADAGSYFVVLTDVVGSTRSDAATLTVNPATGATVPTVAIEPTSFTVASGDVAILSAQGNDDWLEPQSTAPGGSARVLAPSAAQTTDITYQWFLNGEAVAGATNATYILTSVSFDNSGSYTCLVSNPSGSVMTTPASVSSVSTSDPGRLVNLSARALVGAGADQLIAGFIVGGAGTAGAEEVLARASGPALSSYDVGNVLPDPSLSLTSPSGYSNSDCGWGGNSSIAAVAARVGAFAWTSATSADSAILAGLVPGSYTAQVQGASGDTGVALAEIYDAAPTGSYSVQDPRLINLSCRSQVGSGSNVLIAGFAVGGSTSETVLIRASGPALSQFSVPGVLPDPMLTLTGASGTLATNAGWGGDPALAGVMAQVGAFSWGSAATADSAILITLPPGAYTAEVSGASGDTGVALIEVYEVQ